MKKKFYFVALGTIELEDGLDHSKFWAKNAIKNGLDMCDLTSGIEGVNAEDIVLREIPPD
jgi:hypothetical protein